MAKRKEGWKRKRGRGRGKRERKEMRRDYSANLKFRFFLNLSEYADLNKLSTLNELSEEEF